ncbi:hypothetical protein [Sulfurovum sp.]|uniref:hypothetical protein n=1 Tax=Sulfurovum sp. TaxID=1969726 RepID=UPI0035666144
MIETLNGKGNDKFTAHAYTEISVIATGNYHIVIDDEIQSPSKRYYVKKGQVFEILADKTTRHTIHLATIQSRNEINSGEKLVEVIGDDEISIEDRLRSQMMAELSRLASAQGLDTYEDDNDFADNFDEDILSPYETKEMVEEYLLDNNLTAEQLLNPESRSSSNSDELPKKTDNVDPVSDQSEA